MIGGEWYTMVRHGAMLDSAGFLDEGRNAVDDQRIMDWKGHGQCRAAHWDTVADWLERRQGWGGYYHRRLAEAYRHIVPAGSRVAEIGCARGDLLASLAPGYGVGVDFSAAMLAAARQRHPGLRFVRADAHDLGELVAGEAAFDFVILSDLINDVWDVQTVLEQARRLCSPSGRLVINIYSHLWEPILQVARRFGLAPPTLEQSWLTMDDVGQLLELSGFEMVRHWQEILLPLDVPLIAPLVNHYLAKLPPTRWLDLTNIVVARPSPRSTVPRPHRVSVIVPARNEAGNVPEIFRRVPEMGAGTEIVFVEGGSSDDTYAVVAAGIAANPQRACKLLRQTGVGKGDAVRAGFAAATGDVLMILDADLTVMPEDLPRFYEALNTGHGEFINGVRLVYPMENEAMRFFNLLGNKFFSAAFSWLLGQPIKDTLCGTKVLWRDDYLRLAANRAYFGDFDPFGDFDLIFGAARLNRRIVDLPVRYRARIYGDTNIQRWRHGMILLRMVVFAARRIKFI